MNHYHFASDAPLPTVRFYETYFGYRPRKVLGATHVLADETGFLLAIDATESNTPTPVGSHLGFRLASPGAVRALHARMGREGIPVSALETPSPRATHFYCADPTGNRVEVGWYDL